MKRMLAVLAAIVAALVTGTVPAGAAGNWAVTYMDPLPGGFAGDKPYTLGFWVLQHGNHPFEGNLGTVGLRLTGEDGKSLMFEGTALPEAGHYAASVVVPQGVWKVEGIQGMFMPHEVGQLSVPGGLKVKPVNKALIEGFMALRTDYWDAVRPPGFPDLPGDKVTVRTGDAPAAAAPPVATAAPQKVAAAEPAQSSGGVPAYTLLLAAAGGALLAVGALRLPRRKDRKDHQDPPVDSSSETIVISG
ncbi:hypothetical protein ETD86_24135 [Nonomuraea turkmeniaca]|uniref:LPXTG cell wall anchor domain-containing protein n=1 Tax=Nonomuraea turkmeniaca TaxID=103838 RepID=A0A5S4FE07_9ACTN|nr:hypothetical protein [Nonomuraea turkmeniaca]TMR16746.1 hypothetical protein ETD86_24135 [Nonomuraea turkmeniaca]